MSTIRITDSDADGVAAEARSELGRVVAGGGVVLFPADGVYGLGCDPLSPAAIERIDEIKGRDQGKPSAILYFSPLAMRELLPALGPRTREAIAALLPGPLTLVVANPERRYPLACREDPERLGIRLIDGPLAGTACPLFQTSANRSGEPPAAGFDQIAPAIVETVDLAIDGGELTGSASTVVDLTGIEHGGPPEILRPGAISADQLAGRLQALG